MGNNGQHAQTCSDTNDSGNHDRVAMLTHPFVACLAAVVVAGCTSSVATNTPASRDVPANSASSPSGEPTSAVPHVEFHPGYPPAWVKNFKNLPPEVIPGAKLGYSKEESARRLRPEVRELLDVARRLYYESALLARPEELFRSLHVDQVGRRYFDITMSDGSTDKMFREDFKSGGLFSSGAWHGAYYYEGRVDAPPPRWDASLKIKVDAQRECIDSRAVEGYLDLPLDPKRWPPAIHPLPRELWNRHGRAGSGLAISPVPTGADVSVGFVGGCLVRIDFSNRFNLDQISNEEIFKH